MPMHFIKIQMLCFFPKITLNIKRVSLLLQIEIFQKNIKYFLKRREKIRETLQTTFFNPCVQSALPFFVLQINSAFLRTIL